MLKIKNSLINLHRWEHFDLFLLTSISLLLHFSVITMPKSPIFDETYYVPEALNIISGKGTTTLAQPPLGKLFIDLGVSLFGNNPFGWRVFSALFGVICIPLFYLICRELRLSKIISFFATLFFSFENLNFVQSSVAMLDVYSLAFMLLSFYLYLKGRYYSSGISIALAATAKLSGFMTLPIILLYWFFTGRKRGQQLIYSNIITLLSFFVILVLSDLVIWRAFMNPFAQVATMLSHTLSGTFTKYQGGSLLSYPWEWIVYNRTLPYTLNPIYVWMISPPIWALIVPGVFFAIWTAIKGDGAAKFAVCWFSGTYIAWIFIVAVTDRMSYLYYFYPSIGAVALAIALGLKWLINLKGKFQVVVFAGVMAYILLVLYSFVYLAPGLMWLKILCCLVVFIAAFYKLLKTLDQRRLVT